MEVSSAIQQVKGFRVAGVHSGLKQDQALDFAMIVSDRPCTVGAVFTTNQVKAAPVLYDMELLRENNTHIRAVVVNTRCANACTGDQGVANAHRTAQLAAEALGVIENEVLVMSTGVIGTQLPMDKIATGIDGAMDWLGNDWQSTAQAIMTTDTRPKMASVTVNMPGGQTYRVAGIAKGSGMIAPNMATMLGFIVTDAALTPEQAHTFLRASTETTFNRIVVDGDTSTNDSVFLMANGASGIAINSTSQAQFAEALTEVCRKLAQDIVRDGEGATKFITLTIMGAPSPDAAHRIANTIGTSPLVKTAFYGGDANWGRILAAAGRAGVELKVEKITLWISAGEGSDWLMLFANGMPELYDEEQATAIVQSPEIRVTMHCGMGEASTTVWMCDLSHDYVSINGHYRT